METTTVNKAKEKREKQAYEAITYKLNYKLLDFKERFLTMFVNFRMAEIDQQIKNKKKHTCDEKRLRYGYTMETFNKEKEHALSLLEAKKRRISTNTLQFITEANENYTAKFKKMVTSLVEYGVMAYPLEIQHIGGGTQDDFAFLIIHNEITVHARVIFACGEINAPHYRFIITKRKTVN